MLYRLLTREHPRTNPYQFRLSVLARVIPSSEVLSICFYRLLTREYPLLISFVGFDSRLNFYHLILAQKIFNFKIKKKNKKVINLINYLGKA